MAPISSAARTGPRTKDQSIIKELTALRATLIISLSELKSLKARMSAAVAAEGRPPRAERRVLRRRSQKDGYTWQRIEKRAADFLPKPCILHPWPS